MTHDPLKTLLADAEPPAPARDLAFVVGVMKRVEQRKLMINLAWLSAAMLGVTALLFVIMPYVTPALAELGESAWPAVVILTIAAFTLVGLDQARRVLRQFGFNF